MIEYLIWVLIDFSEGFVVGYLCGKSRYDLALVVVSIIVALWLLVLCVVSTSDIQLTITPTDCIAMVAYIIATYAGCEIGYKVASR